MLGRRSADVLPPAVARESDEHVAAAIAAGKLVEFEHVAESRGRPLHVIKRITPVARRGRHGRSG